MLCAARSPTPSSRPARWEVASSAHGTFKFRTSEPLACRLQSCPSLGLFSRISRQIVRPTRKKQSPATQATITPMTFVSPEGCPTAETANEAIRARLTAATTAAIDTTPTRRINPKQPERNRPLPETPPRQQTPSNYTRAAPSRPAPPGHLTTRFARVKYEFGKFLKTACNPG